MSHTIRIFSLSYTFSITKYWKKEKRKFSLKAQSSWYYLADFFPYISAYDVPYIHVHMVFLVKPSHRHLTLYIFLIIKNTYRLPVYYKWMGIYFLIYYEKNKYYVMCLWTQPLVRITKTNYNEDQHDHLLVYFFLHISMFTSI